MRLPNAVLPIAVLSAVLFISPVAVAVETLWTYHAPSGHIAGSPAVGDVDGDGRVDVVVATTGGSVIALDSSANQLWRRDVGEMVTVPPTLSDVIGDAAAEVLALDNSGRVYCLDAVTGNLLWERRLPARVDWGCTSIVAQDINHDGMVEIVTGDAEGSVVCLDGSGNVVWRYAGSHGYTRCPAVGDLDGDGFPEILVGGTTTALVCLSHTGEEKWTIDSEPLGSSPVIWDLDGDGSQEVVAGIGKHLAAVSADGQVLWTHEMKMGDDITTIGIDSAISVADADRDGTPEIYAGDLTGFFACLAPDGSLRWSSRLGKRARRSPSVADVDGDGNQEILVAGYSGSIHVFAPDGTLKEKVPIGGESNATATVADLMGDGRLCVICPSESGGMPVFRWPDAKANAEVQWPEYRLNANRTAAMVLESAQLPPAIAGFETGKCYTGSNTFAVQVENPNLAHLTIHLTLTGEGIGVSESSLTSSDAAIEHHVSYSVSGRHPVTLAFSCTVKERAKTLIERTQRVYVEPFRKELVDAEQRIEELRDLVPHLVDPGGFRGEILEFEEALEESRSDALLGSALTDKERGELQLKLGNLLERSARLLDRVRAAVAVRDNCTGPLLLAAANPWAPFGGMEEAVEGRTPPPNLKVKAFYGERESAALNIFNFGNSPKSMRVELGVLSPQEGSQSVPAKQVVALREVVDVPTQIMDLSADALPSMNQGNVLLAPSWSARQIWLDVDTTGLSPGTWSGSVRLRTLEPESIELTADLEATVWKTALPEEQPLRLCHWGYVHSSRLKDQPEVALQDQVDHGTNVFVGTFSPRAKYNENGEIVGEIDFTAHDAHVSRHAPHGVILFVGYQGGVSGPGGFGSPAYEKAHVEYLRRWVKHLSEMGVGYDGFALYPVDEMGLHPGGVERYFACAKLARKADPSIQMYTDPAPGVTMEELEMTKDYADIWCPSTGFAFNEEHLPKLDFMKSTGSTLWTYACSGHAKHLAPLSYYRGQAWFAWQHGMTGIGFWSYCTGRDDPWFSAPANAEHLLVYQGKGVVASKRWKAIRDGIEDYSMLSVLRDARNGKSGKAAQEAEHLLGEGASAIGEFAHEEVGGTAIWRPEQAEEARQTADERWEAYQATRENMARLLQELGK